MTNIKTFDSVEEGLVKVFVGYNEVDDDGNIISFSAGNSNADNTSGIVFIVEEDIAEQFDNLYIDFSGRRPNLKVKKGKRIKKTMLSQDQERQEIDDIKALERAIQKKKKNILEKGNPKRLEEL